MTYDTIYYVIYRYITGQYWSIKLLQFNTTVYPDSLYSIIYDIGISKLHLKFSYIYIVYDLI